MTGAMRGTGATGLTASLPAESEAGSEFSGRQRLRVLRALWRPSVFVALAYVALLVGYARHYNYTPIDFVHIGTIFSEGDPQGGWGYDGQFYYYVARDPLGAAAFLDNPTYRLRRILYPLLARALALGHVDAIPLAMLGINVGAVVAGTELLSRLLRRAGISGWYALGYGVAFGQVASVTHQLADPLGSAFLVAAIWAAHHRRLALAGVWFGLASLTRDSLALVPLGYIAGYVLQRQWRAAVSIAGLGVLPLALWTLALEAMFQGAYDTGVTWTPIAEAIPLLGTLRTFRITPSFVITVLCFLLPSWLVAVFAVQIAWREWRQRRALPSPLWWGWLAPASLLTLLAAEQVIDFLVPARLAIGVSTTTAAFAATARSLRVRLLAAYFAATGVLYPPMVYLGSSSVIP